ncbi:serine/threonine protein kinase, CMGC, partial [Paramarasmius palmivorus]
MLHPDPESRPTAAQLIRHPFLKILSPPSSASPGRYKKTSTASTPANSPPRQNAQRRTGWGIIDNPGEGNAGGPLGYLLGGVG